MGFDPHEPEQRHLLRAALKAADIQPGELWLKYFSLGGAAGEYEVEAYLQGLLSMPVLERDLLAMAANELIDDIPRSRAPYSSELQDENTPEQNAPDSPTASEQSRTEPRDPD